MYNASNPEELDAFHKQLEDNDRLRKQRKLVNLDIRETSGVSAPAHGASGWVVMKSAGPPEHQHRADAMYLGGMALDSARQLLNSDTVATGAEKAISPDDPSRVMGRSECGCLYLRTPESVEKAATEEAMNGMAKAAPLKRTWTPEEIAYLMGETKQDQP